MSGCRFDSVSDLPEKYREKINAEIKRQNVNRAARAAAVSPVAGLSPSHVRPRQSAPAARAASAASAVQRALSGFSP